MKSVANRVGFKSVVLLLLAMALMSCGGAEQRKTKYLDQAKTYIEQDNLDKARVELKNVLQIDPKHVEAYFLLGQLEEKRQNWDQAFGNYSKVVELNPNHIEARAKLGILYLLTGNVASATEMMERILAVQPDDLEGKLLKAAILVKQDRSAEAVKIAEKLVSENPGHANAVNFLASLYERQGEKKKAIEILQRSVQLNKKDTGLRLHLAKLYSPKTEVGKIEELLLENIAIEPSRLDHKLMLVGLYSETNQIDKAENVLREAIKEKPAETSRILLLVDFLAKKRSVALAEKELVNAVQANSKSYDLRNVLADLYERTNRASQAESIYKEIIDQEGTNPEGLKASVRLAKILIGSGRIPDGEKLVKKVIETNPRDVGALLVQARLQISKNDVQNAIVSLRSVLKDQPNSAETLTLLGEAHMLSNEPELAYDYFQKAVSENPGNADARLKLAQYLVTAKKDINGGLAQIDAILASSPNHMLALLAKADLLSMQHKYDAVKKVLDAVVKAYPDSPVGYRSLGQLYLEQKKYEPAIQQLEISLEKTPANNAYQALASIVNAYLLQAKPDKAVARLNRILGADANNLDARELLGEVYLSQKKYDEAKAEFRKAVAINPKWNQLYRNLAGIEGLRGGFKAAIPVYQEGLKAIPDDIGLLMLLAEAYERTRDVDNAIASYEHILQINPAYQLVRNNLASLLVDYKGDPKSISRAKELTQEFENTKFAPYIDTLGWVYYKSGDLDKSVAFLEQAVKAAPDIAIFRYHLGMAYYKKGNSAQAKLHLARAVTPNANFMGIDEARSVLKQLQ